MHILFAGGGTAGHINPALAVAGYIKRIEPDCKISFVGTARGMESRLVPLEGYDFYTIDVAGFQRKLTVKNIFRNINAVCKVVTSSFASKKLLKKLQPDVVVGTGGYVCGPILREAAKMGIKTAVHEANAYPGVTIKMLAPLVDAVMIAMDDAAGKLNCKNTPFITGNPIRKGLTDMDKKTARQKLNIPETADVVLSFGGSLGARIINESMFDVIKWNCKNKQFYVYHGTGKLGYADFVKKLSDADCGDKNEYINIYEYIDNMDVLMAAADIVVCRAGAMTINELQVCGKPSVLVPSPYVAENHQFHNAMSLKRIGAAELIEEKDLNGEILLETIKKMFADKTALAEMSQKARASAVVDADRRISEIILNL